MCGQVHSPTRMCSSPPTLRLGTHADGLTTDTCAPRTWTRPPSPPVHTAVPTWCSSRRQRGLGLSAKLGARRPRRGSLLNLKCLCHSGTCF